MRGLSESVYKWVSTCIFVYIRRKTSQSIKSYTSRVTSYITSVICPVKTYWYSKYNFKYINFNYNFIWLVQLILGAPLNWSQGAYPVCPARNQSLIPGIPYLPISNTGKRGSAPRMSIIPNTFSDNVYFLFKDSHKRVLIIIYHTDTLGLYPGY